ncbi:MAG TPA: hypothetical protein VIM37_04170 [Candidatus Microsaccharimonas sp.]|jgi:hypothetical protein
MNIYAEGTFTGKPAISTATELAKAEYVSAHEFAPTKEGFGAANIALAEYIAQHYSHLPIFAAQRIAGALKEVAPEIEIAGEFRLDSSDSTASQGGTWAEFEQVKSLNPDNWENPLLIAQRHHVGRVAMQARRFGMTPAVPGGLPDMFDPSSEQWWCRNPVAWAVREIPGVPVLRLRGQL